MSKSGSNASNSEGLRADYTMFSHILTIFHRVWFLLGVEIMRRGLE